MRNAAILRALRADRRGAAAAEMALVTPLLVAMLFATVEGSRYFLDEHVALKAVRDGARYAARQNFSAMPCGGTSTKLDQIRNVVRYGNIAGTGYPRLDYWTSATTVSVTIACPANASYSGIYKDMATIPTVTVAATVPYVSLFGLLGFNTNGLNIRAQSQSTVAGI